MYVSARGTAFVTVLFRQFQPELRRICQEYFQRNKSVLNLSVVSSGILQQQVNFASLPNTFPILKRQETDDRFTGETIRRSYHISSPQMSAPEAISPKSVQLQVNPENSLVDDVIDVRVLNLPAFHDVTLVCVLDEGGKVYLSCGQYVSDQNGSVDVAHSISLDGTFAGIERMGLLWSMKPADDQPVGIRLMKNDVTTPFTIDLYVLDGHQAISNPNQLTGSKIKIFAKKRINRYYQDSKVRAIPVREGALRGIFYVPSGEGPFPGVIDMFGTAGGLMKFRAALLASRGIATLALPYFDYEDLPKNIQIDYQYFLDAVDWLYKQPMINRNSGGVGVVAVSKGATIALQMATLSNKVKAVVSINASCIHHTGIHTYKGEPQPVFTPTAEDFERGFKKTDEGYTFGEVYRPTAENEDACVPIEQAPHCKFLLIVGEDDPSTLYCNATVLIHRLLRHGLNNYRLLSYPGAGHLIEPPYTPHCRTAYAKLIGSTVLYGGQTKAHSIAQEDAWKQTLTFLKEELSSKTQTSANSKL